MLSQARGARQINKTLQVPFPTECCGTSKSSHLFVGSGGCDLACLRKHAEPRKSARRFKTSLRLTAAEQTSVHIGSSNPVAATSDDAGNVFVQAVELRASSGMLSRQGVHPTPWQCTLSHACHAKEAEPKGRQGVHPTPWQCTLSHACHAKEAEPKGRQGVHPTPWQCTLSHTCHAKCTWSHACHAKEAEPKGRQGVHPTPWQCTLSHACHAKEAEPKGRQGVHPTPWQYTLSHACHAKEAEPKGRQGVHPTPWQCTLSC